MNKAVESVTLASFLLHSLSALKMKTVRKQEKTRQGCCWYFCCCFSLFLCLRIFPKCLRESFLQPFLLLFWGRWINRLRLWLVLVFIHRSLKNFRLLVWIKSPTNDVLVTYEASIMILNSIFVRMVTTTTSVSSETVRKFSTSSAAVSASWTVKHGKVCQKQFRRELCHTFPSSSGEIFHRIFISASEKRSRSWSIYRMSRYIHLNAIRCQNEITVSVVATFAVINIEIFRAASTTVPILVSRRLSSSSGWVGKLPSSRTAEMLRSQCKRMFVMWLPKAKSEQSEMFRLFDLV